MFHYQFQDIKKKFFQKEMIWKATENKYKKLKNTRLIVAILTFFPSKGKHIKQKSIIIKKKKEIIKCMQN